MVGEASVIFDITHASFHVVELNDDGTVSVDHEIGGFSSDGFGMTPSEEATMIEGLMGEVGFNIDPSTAAEATCSLKTTSPDNDILRDIYKRHRSGDLGPLRVYIQVEDGREAEFGFKRRTIQQAMIRKFPEFSTDGKSSPNIEWEIVGFGYDEVSA